MTDKLPPEVAEADAKFRALARTFPQDHRALFEKLGDGILDLTRQNLALTDENARLRKLCEDFTFADNAALRRSNERAEQAEAERDALKARIAEAPVARVEAPYITMPLQLRDADPLVCRLHDKRVALVVVEDGE